MDRRQFLAAGGAAAAAGLAGCRSMFQTRSARSPPLVEDRPDAVYYPTHVEGMKMVGATEAGDYGVALTYSFPHRFWLVDGEETTKVAVRGEDSLHMMSVVWDRETGTVVPNSSIKTTVSADGEVVAEKPLWSMLSQNMGVHAGDNIALDGDGTYEVDLEIGPVSARRTGAVADRFDELTTASFTLAFRQSTLEDISFERLPDKQGEKGAVEGMEMGDVPVARAPDPDSLPGTAVGTAESGGARVVAVRLSTPPAGVGREDESENESAGESESGYLAVSPRTPYNRYPLAFTTVSATVTREGDEVFAGRLDPTFDPDLGYHYGGVADLASGDDLTLSVDLPPQLARHEGYETAFLSFEDVSMTV
jgi:hypothetical protein